MAVDTGELTVIGQALTIEPSGSYGFLKEGGLYLAPSTLVLSTIALSQMEGLHFGDDGTTTAVVAVQTALSDDQRLKIGRSVEYALRDYEDTTLGESRSEYVGHLTAEGAVTLLGFAVERATRG